ncbi:MAG: DUF3788 domain-containing protein, partial [Marinilabiliaceae bacterium]|nr:DUF3788 domain-containing protein [Marinilabiliaceae bacterium]
MDDISIFTDKAIEPASQDLVNRLASSYALWQHIYDFVFRQYPKCIAEWNYPGKKYGWSFRIKDKKRAIIYLLPREGYFKVAFVFGQKATDAIMESDISDSIKAELAQARKYAEGRGINFDIRNEDVLGDVE